MQYDRTKIVDPVSLVGMLMGQKHCVDVIDVGVDQLLAQIGRGVDHDPRHSAIPAALGEQRAAAAAGFWIVGIARTPTERGAGNPGRGSAAQNRQGQRHAISFAGGTLENRRKKFSVVCREICSSESARISASTLAISTT